MKGGVDDPGLNVVWNYPTDPKTVKQRIALLSVGILVGIAIFLAVILLISLPETVDHSREGICPAGDEYFLSEPEENDMVNDGRNCGKLFRIAATGMQNIPVVIDLFAKRTSNRMLQSYFQLTRTVMICWDCSIVPLAGTTLVPSLVILSVAIPGKMEFLLSVLHFVMNCMILATVCCLHKTDFVPLDPLVLSKKKDFNSRNTMTLLMDTQNSAKIGDCKLTLSIASVGHCLYQKYQSSVH